MLLTGRRRALLVPPPDPRRIPGLRAWWDAGLSARTLAAGMAAQFTAANSEYLSIADNTSLSAGDIDFTIAAWVRLDTLPGASEFTIASKWLETGSQQEWRLIITTTPKVRFQVSNDGAAAVGNADATTITTNTWYFVVAWHDSVANTVNVQVDNGTITSTAHTTGVFDGTGAFTLGAISNPLLYLDGKEQCVGFWKSVLTAAQRTALYNGGTPLTADQAERAVGRGISYWELSEPSGTRKDLWGSNDLTDNNTVTTAAGTALNAIGQINDLSGLGNHASQSTQANKPVIRFGENGLGGQPALLFDNTNDHLRADSLAAMMSGQDAPFTCIAAFRAAGVADANSIIGAGLSTDAQAWMEITLTAVPLYSIDRKDGLTRVTANGTLTPDTNAHIWSVVFPGTTVSTFVDGVVCHNAVAMNTDTVTFDQVAVGAVIEGGSAANFFNGRIGSIAIYDRALSTRERRAVEAYFARRYGITVT